MYTSESSETLTSIPADMEYEVEVTAVNVQGSGDPSNAYVLISGQPDMPTNVEARGAVGAIEMCWTKPAGTLTAYRIDLSRGSYVAAVTATVDALVAPSWCVSPKVGHTFSGDDDGIDVALGTLHTLTVKATVSTSDYVFGVASAEATATPYDVPGAPSIDTVTTTASTATVTWSAAAPRGNTVSGYTAYAMPTGETCTWTTGPLACTITNLTGNDTYGFYVEATNDAGVGPASATVNATIDATAPSPTWGAPEMGANRRLAYTATFDEIIYYSVVFDEPVTGFALVDDDLRNAGTAPGCIFGLTARTTRAYDMTVQCSGTGTLVAQIVAGSVTDNAGNTGPTLGVSAALVTLYDPSTTSSALPTSTSPPPSSAPDTSSSLPEGNGEGGAGAGLSTTTTEAEGLASVARATSSTSEAPTTSTQEPTGAGGATTTLAPWSNTETETRLPAEIADRLPSEKIASPDRPSAGDAVTLEKCGFAAGENVQVYVGSTVVDRTKADDRGCVEVEVDLPRAVSGRVEVALYAPNSQTGAKAVLTVVGNLAATGSDTGSSLLFAAFVVLVGAAMLAASRKRRRPT